MTVQSTPAAAGEAFPGNAMSQEPGTARRK